MRHWYYWQKGSKNGQFCGFYWSQVEREKDMTGRTCAYLPVSKLDQDIEKNKMDILKLYYEQMFGQIEFGEEKVSGSVSWCKRQVGFVWTWITKRMFPLNERDQERELAKITHKTNRMDGRGISLLCDRAVVACMRSMEEIQCSQHPHEEAMMADQEHVERLKHSIYEWNMWRQGHPEIQPDLSYADLRQTRLIGAKLNKADLSFADLSMTDHTGVNLNRANLSFANLIHTNFNHADLSYTNLRRVNLNDAHLSDADLSFADLSFTYLSHTGLGGTIFEQTRFFLTVFVGVDLSSIKRLETAIHEGPSVVHINSVTLPHDEPTRLHFLRGVGFTETQIEYLPSLLTPRPIEYASLFISYAHQDETVAKRLYTDLRKKDVPCWFAPHDLRPGTPILRGIEEAIHWSDRFLLILSKHAVESPWIEREVDAALHQEIKRGQDVLFPICLDNAVLESHAGWATRLQHRHIGNFTGWRGETFYQEAFATLLRHLKVAKASVNGRVSISGNSSLSPCRHESRPGARFCHVCGTAVPV